MKDIKMNNEKNLLGRFGNDLYVGRYNFETLLDFMVESIDVEEFCFIFYLDYEQTHDYDYENIRTKSTKKRQCMHLLKTANKLGHMCPFLCVLFRLYLKQNGSVQKIKRMGIDKQLEFAYEEAFSDKVIHEVAHIRKLLDVKN